MHPAETGVIREHDEHTLAQRASQMCDRRIHRDYQIQLIYRRRGVQEVGSKIDGWKRRARISQFGESGARLKAVERDAGHGCQGPEFLKRHRPTRVPVSLVVKRTAPGDADVVTGRCSETVSPVLP